jgi:hypothetical protein
MFSARKRRYRHVRTHAFAAIAALLIVNHAADAQVLYGSLTGNITDSSGAAVPGATVEALSTSTGVATHTTSERSGAYQINSLQQGVYRVTVSANGFASFVQNNVQVNANTDVRIDVRLELAGVNQSVTVDASAVTLQADRADVNAEIGTAQLADLPTGPNRNFQNLYKIIPGFSPPAASHSSAANPQLGLTSTVNGVTGGNNTRIDGASIMYPWLTDVTSYVPPAEALEAVNIVSSSFDAEQGYASGAEVNVTMKSGTNEFHGAAWEYNTNSDLKARNFFYLGNTNPKNILNQFGLDLGGPIRKNKLFFFADWERTIQTQLFSGFQTVATDPLRQGNFAGIGTTIYDPTTGTSTGTGRQPFPGNAIPASMLSSAALKMASLLPKPNVPGGVSNDYFATADGYYRKDAVDMKVNYNPNEKTSIFGRYSISPTLVFDPQALGAAGGNTIDGGQPGHAPGKAQNAVAGGTYTITPHFIVDGNVGFTRLDVASKNVDIDQNFGLNVLNIPGTNGPNPLQGGIPNFGISGFSSLGNPNTSNPFFQVDDQYVGSLNAGWIKGAHSIRFGGDLLHFTLNHFQANTNYGVRGGFNFTGGLTALNGGTAPNMYNAWADFMLGLPQAMGQDHQYIAPAVLKEDYLGLYIRDQWQVSRKLTFTYGMRYEIHPYGYSKYGIGGIRYDPTTNNTYLGGVNGVPYDAGVNTGHGMVAPRLGVAYRLDDKTVIRAGYGINISPSTFIGNIQIYPEVIAVQYSGLNSYSAAGSLLTGIPPFAGPNLSAGILPLPTNVGTVTFGRNYVRSYDESMNFTIQRNLGAGVDLQVGYVGDRQIHGSTGVNLNTAPPGTGKAGQPLYQEFGNASTISLNEPLGTSRFNALEARALRRVGARSTVGAAYTFSKILSGSSTPFPWLPPHRNYYVNSIDRTHNLSIYGTYALPFGKGGTWFTGGWGAAILGGWEVNAILQRMSGTPFTVSSSGTSLNAPGNSQTAEQVNPSVAILGGHGPGSPYFDPNAFAPVTTATFGNSGFDILRGPGTFNLDASLYRTFPIRERFSLQFRAESFGLTNTPQFANPSATVSNATFSNGVVTNLNGYDIITSSTGERQIRFGLKLSF